MSLKDPNGNPISERTIIVAYRIDDDTTAFSPAEEFDRVYRKNEDKPEIIARGMISDVYRTLDARAKFINLSEDATHA